MVVDAVAVAIVVVAVAAASIVFNIMQLCELLLL